MTIATRPPETESAALGVLPTLVRELMALGIQIDPSREPVRQPTRAERYADFPVVFRAATYG